MKRGYDGLRQHVPNPVVARLGDRALPTLFRRAAQVTWNSRNMYLKNGSSMYRFTQFNP